MVLETITRAIPRRFRPLRGLAAPGVLQFQNPNPSDVIPGRRVAASPESISPGCGYAWPSGSPSGEGDEIVLTHPLQNKEHG
jgi:hypothetical protein